MGCANVQTNPCIYKGFLTVSPIGPVPLRMTTGPFQWMVFWSCPTKLVCFKQEKWWSNSPPRNRDLDGLRYSVIFFDYIGYVELWYLIFGYIWTVLRAHSVNSCDVQPALMCFEFLRFLAAGVDWDKLHMLKRVPQNEWNHCHFRNMVIIHF